MADASAIRLEILRSNQLLDPALQPIPGGIGSEGYVKSLRLAADGSGLEHVSRYRGVRTSRLAKRASDPLTGGGSGE